MLTFPHAQTSNQLTVLNNFITAHNTGTDQALTQFIQENYETAIVDEMNLSAHLKFYQQIVQEFGTLNPFIYKKIEEKPEKLVVHLIKENESLLNQHIDPENILVLEMDLTKSSPQYLSKGLGLGSLLCELKK